MISIIIPTLNSERTLEACLRVRLAQRLSRDRYEIVVADAGSTDQTLAIARDCGVDRIVENPLRTGEAGKCVGIRGAIGDLFALVGSDNILPDDRWLERMTAPFDKPAIVAGEPLAYTVRPGDPTSAFGEGRDYWLSHDLVPSWRTLQRIYGAAAKRCLIALPRLAVAWVPGTAWLAGACLAEILVAKGNAEV